jgi:hypothetical protein
MHVVKHADSKLKVISGVPSRQFSVIEAACNRDVAMFRPITKRQPINHSSPLLVQSYALVGLMPSSIDRLR